MDGGVRRVHAYGHGPNSHVRQLAGQLRGQVPAVGDDPHLEPLSTCLPKDVDAVRSDKDLSAGNEHKKRAQILQVREEPPILVEAELASLAINEVAVLAVQIAPVRHIDVYSEQHVHLLRAGDQERMSVRDFG